MLGFLERRNMKLFFYKGGLHKVIGVPRRWSAPSPAIKLSLFRYALRKRNEALLRKERSCTFSSSEETHSEEGKVSLFLEDDVTSRKRKRALDDADDEQVRPAEAQQIQVPPSEEHSQDHAEQALPAQEQPAQPLPEDTAQTETQEDRAKRKAELQEKLRKLTTEKHRYVLILKQILSNEEESKKKVPGSLQSPAAGTSSALGSKPASETSPALPSDGGMQPMELEEGELECARTPSPRSGGTQSKLYKSAKAVKWDNPDAMA